uniref:YkgJ family cysteine cluster protein n=1 Tax=Desulfobacca acetoxidans TaxID=60893 RepID=A0A7C5AK67_9BACT
MQKRRFTGKIRTDPWDSLAQGPREVMASIWEDYLVDLLGGSLKEPRHRVLRRRVEEAADYSKIYRDWNNLPPEDRGEAWRRLVTTARRHFEASRDECLRCGECCVRSGPPLLVQDLPLLHREVITMNEVYTLRVGERVISRDNTPMTLAEERLMIREVPGTRQCTFYRVATQSCRIYPDRPEYCRRQQCWGEPPPPPAPEELLTRRHLLKEVPEMWDLITAHEERCHLPRLRHSLEEVAAGREEAGDLLFDALHFDHYLRKMLEEEWGLSGAATELLLGRPLTCFLKDLGLQATLTPEGSYRLTPRCTSC